LLANKHVVQDEIYAIIYITGFTHSPHSKK